MQDAKCIMQNGRRLAPTADILHSAFCILHSAFCILHSASCILHPASCILHYGRGEAAVSLLFQVLKATYHVPCASRRRRFRYFIDSPPARPALMVT
jgi:hypothetical protein